MSASTTDLDIHDMVRELTQGNQHHEPYEVKVEGGTVYRLRHTSYVPALVLQLLASTPTVAGTGDLSGTQATSRPTARIEALDTVMLIDDEAGEWIDRLGGIIPADLIDPDTHRTVVGSGTLRRLNRLHGLYPSTKTCKLPKHGRLDPELVEAQLEEAVGFGEAGWCCPRGHLEHDVRRWWHQARIITGWDMAAWIPNNTCPECDQRRKLRIRLDSAMCIECRTVWPEERLGILAEHIRAENREEDTLASDVVEEEDENLPTSA